MIYIFTFSLVEYSFVLKNIFLCFEYFPYDLKKFMVQKHEKGQRLTFPRIKTIMFQLLKGLEYIHSRKVLHRDLKPHNILINENYHCKIADFGLSRVFSVPLRPYTKEVLTQWYRAPELILGMNEYSSGLDMWSMGCIFGEILLGAPLFQGNSEIDQLFRIFRVLGTPNDSIVPMFSSFPELTEEFPLFEPVGLSSVMHKAPEIDALAMDLLERMLNLNPALRITAKEALTHVSFWI